MAATTLKHLPPCEEITSIKEWVNGNGHPGAKTRLALIEDNLGEIKETLKWLRNAVSGLILTIVGALLIWVFTNLIPRLLAG